MHDSQISKLDYIRYLNKMFDYSIRVYQSAVCERPIFLYVGLLAKCQHNARITILYIMLKII